MREVKVKWIDSTASNLGWTLLSELEGEVQPIHITTYGVIIQDNEDVIVVAQNIGTNQEQCCSLMTIPKGCIKEIIELRP